MSTRFPELADFFARHAVLRGEFTLASGRKSDYYIDGKQVTYSPRGLELIVEALRTEVAGFDVQAVGGIESGANPIVAAFALHSARTERPVPAFYVRKQAKTHGAQKRIEGIVPPPGARVAVIDDVVTTGGSTLQTVDAVEEIGGKVVLAVSIVDRLAGAAEALARRNIPYRPLLTITDLGLTA